MSAIKKVLGLTLLVLMAASVSEAQITSVRQTNRQELRQLVRRIQDRVDLLRTSLNNQSPRGGIYREENATVLLTSFDEALGQLRQAITQRNDTSVQAQLVLDRASALDNFIGRRNVDATTQRYWSNARVDLNQLAQTYGLTWNASTGNRNPGRWPLGTARLTGTYRIDATRSENAATVIDRALRSLPYQQRQQRRDQLLRRLDAPDQIAINVSGRNVTLASSRAQQIAFEADGRERVETTPSGRAIRVTSSLNADQLTITTTGDRDNEFNVTFFPLENGRRMRVTRRIYSENLSTPIEIQSFYDRSSDVAEFDSIYSGPRDNPGTDTNNDYLLRNGETVVAELSSSLSTRTSQDGEQFTATIRTPAQYAGAVIEGHVSTVKRSGRITGRSEMTFNFDRLRLRDGRSYRIAGYLQTVRMPNGDVARVDNEGAVQDDNQSKKTVERTAIGTAVGAIIGEIAGGGKGAAIGAVIGAGGGAGSVYIQGRDDLELPVGTELTIQVTGPNRN